MARETQEGGSSADLEEPRQIDRAAMPLWVSQQEGAAKAGEEPTGQGEEGAQAPGPAMSEALLQEYDYSDPKRGDVRNGLVIGGDGDYYVVDVGAKRECLVAVSDYRKLGGAADESPLGKELPVYILRADAQDGHLVGSFYLAEVERDWDLAEEYEASGRIFEAEAVAQNRGGLLVHFGRLRGFVPASHLVDSGSSGTAGKPVALDHWVGKVLPFKVIEVNRRRNRLILSYRAARRQWRSQQKENLLEKLHEGDVCKGVVSSLASFGAFVDLGGADGLIHVSELAWYRVGHPSELLRVGQEIAVYVLRVDPARGRVGLSLKRLQPDPWTLVQEKYQPGQLLPVRVSKLVDFGAFAEIEKGVEGLIHLTEISDPPPARPEDALEPGQVCLAKVLRVDAQNRRIGLSLRAVTPEEQAAWEAQHPQGAQPAEGQEPGAPAQPAGADAAGDVAEGADAI
jgi:small subunit ribosomal protein S1